GYSLAKGDRTEWAAAKLAELGTDRIVPLICERTVVRPEDEAGQRRSQRLQRIVREAAMQARLVHLPTVTEPRPFAEMLTTHPASATCLADPAGGAPSLDSPVVLIGPEGGWSQGELAMARREGVGSVALSPHVLRVETAAVAAGAILAAFRANLVPPRTL
ncbi:MAG: RsmE family RNA methyltransferase, partial [Acidimicrobiales bacterium]